MLKNTLISKTFGPNPNLSLLALVARSAGWSALGVLLVAALQTVAFQPRGETAHYFANNVAPSLPPKIVWPPVNSSGLQTPQPLSSVTVDIWFLDNPEAFSAETIFAERLERGYTHSGELAYFIEFSEAGLDQYLNYWFGGWAQRTSQLRNTRAALKSGGLIIYAEINLGVYWQPVGAVFNLDDSGRQFVIAGVDIDGQLLSAPPSGPIAEGVKALEENGNRALRELIIIDPEGNLAIQQIVLTEDTAQIIAQ